MTQLVGVRGFAEEIRARLRRARDPRERSELNDLWQQQRSQTRPRPRRSAGPKRRDAHLWARPRPRVTRMPDGYRGESELARRRRERAARKAVGR